MHPYNIHITGVGGQGVGLLSEALLRSIDYAGMRSIGVDTHGLAQRGGVVISRIRCGDRAHSPLTLQGVADLVLALEINEALRGVCAALKDKGTLAYLNVAWQPLSVRLGQAKAVTAEEIDKACQKRHIKVYAISNAEIKEARMQNMALLGTVARHNLVPGVDVVHILKALADLLPPKILTRNLEVFHLYASNPAPSLQ